MEESAACIIGFNSHAICIEMRAILTLVMTVQHRDTIIKMNAILGNKFNIPINTYRIVYHHWFDLKTGTRNNGTKNNKSCPGTAFFGGNKVADCLVNFIPLVQQAANGIATPTPAIVQEYRIITADLLNVRTAASAWALKTKDRAAIPLGSVVRVI